ncbi:MAG: hypothetical protein ACJ8M4_07795 [Chthoniobacterales bacterium]
MIKKFIGVFVFVGFAASLSFAEPSPNSSQSKTTKHSRSSKKSERSVVVPANPTSGWSLAKGVWVHSDGYKFVNGQVVRSSAQTHKPAPTPPTKAEMDAATKMKSAPKTSAELAAEKAAERERNLAPRPAPQTGSHL